MAKIDCSVTVNFLKEWRRYCGGRRCGYSDEEMRRQIWWFTNKWLPAALADEPTVELEVMHETD